MRARVNRKLAAVSVLTSVLIAIAGLSMAHATEQTALLIQKAQSLVERHDFDRATGALEQTLAKVRRSRRPVDFDIGAMLRTLSNATAQAGTPRETEPIQRALIEIEEVAFPPDHPIVAETLVFLGAALSGEGQFTQAEAAFRRSVNIREKSLGPKSAVVAESLAYLGSTINLEGRFSEAEPLLTRALSIYEKAYGSDNPAVAQVLVYLGGALERVGSPTPRQR